MDCETCTDRLVELLYDELPREAAEETRGHLSGCPSCAEAWERVRIGKGFAALLELVDPPVTVLDSVMAAARERASERLPSRNPEPSRVATEAGPEEARGSGPWAVFLKWIGGFAMRPQFAMAMTLLLMVGLGMWYLPALRQSDPADSHAIVDPAPGDEVGPSASLEPAQPLDLHADPRTGRIRPRDDEPTEPPPPVARSTEAEAAPPASRRQAEGAEETDDAEDREPRRPSSELARRPPPVVEEAAPDPRAADTIVDLAPGQAIADGVARTQAPGRSATPAMTAQVEAAPAPTAGRPPAPAPRGAPARYARGLQNQRQRNYRAAAEDFASVVERPGLDRRLIPSSLDHLAQSQARANNCPAAVRTYERLIREHPRYSGIAEARVDAARCYQSMGRLSDARRHLERARTVPRVSLMANRMLVVLDQQERGRDALRAAPAEAAEAAETEPASPPE